MTLREFDSELASVAGRHDGVRQRVNADSLTDTLVAEHENVHAEIITGTSDGKLLGTLYGMSMAESPLTASDKELLRSSARKMMESSRMAHESFATFLGLHRNPMQLSNWRENLTVEYVSYYENIASHIRPEKFPSNASLCWLVTNMALVVFRSGLLSFQKRSSTLVISNIKDCYNANMRMASLLNSVKCRENELRQIMREVSRRAARIHGENEWDIDDNDSLMQVSGRKAFIKSSYALRDAIAKYARIPMISKKEDVLCLRWLSKQAERANFRSMLMFEDSNEAEVTANNQFLGRICRQGEPPSRLDFDQLRADSSIVSLSFLRKCLKEGEAEWLVSGWRTSLVGTHPPDVLAHTVDELAVYQLISSWQLGQLVGPGRRQGVLSVCVATDNAGLLVQEFESVLRHAPVIRKILSFYWLGSWTELIALIEMRQVAYPRDSHRIAHLYEIELMSSIGLLASSARVYYSPVWGPIFRILTTVGTAHADRAEAGISCVHRDGNDKRIELAMLYLQHAVQDVVIQMDEY